MEKFNYKIGGISYLQTELTWKNDKKLIALYGRVHSVAFKQEELRLKDLQPLLAKYNLLNHFFGIILRPQLSFRYIVSFKWASYRLGKISLDHATNSEIGQIFQDFFLLNRAFGTKLKEWANALGLIATEAEKMKVNKK